MTGAPMDFQPESISRKIFYRDETERGYHAEGTVWSPGYFAGVLEPGHSVTLTASMEGPACLRALTPEEAADEEWRRRALLLGDARPLGDDRFSSELALAADEFLMTPAGRRESPVGLQTGGRAARPGTRTGPGRSRPRDPASPPPGSNRSIIAGYHWFTDWGRDTMISLEGLCLILGRFDEARTILGSFAAHMRNGLIPNLFPEGQVEARYNTADATLWFVHALDRYVVYTKDLEFLSPLLPTLRELISYHVTGTSFGIGVDEEDGLLRQGTDGVALTWMDAQMEDWVVTPRRGKAVEINALWYNALRVIEAWSAEEGRAKQAAALAELADRARTSFNRRFWFEEGGYLYDVVDGPLGDDPACRPNQLLSVSLPHPVLDESRWEAVLNVVRERLLTPFGLRTLSPEHPDFSDKYRGDLRARDAAYHQGTVWPWLIGPFVDAWLKLHPDDRAGARRLLHAFEDHLDEACIGSISEVFDATAPYLPGGCAAQAWSVAEVLRSWVATSGESAPLPAATLSAGGGAPGRRR
jgi:glycogen debranching enzyme